MLYATMRIGNNCEYFLFQSSSNNHIWVQGDLIIKLNMKDESKPPYGSEKIPIITYEYIPSLIN